MTKSTQIYVRVPPTLKAAIAQDAKGKALTESALIRMILKQHYDSQARTTSIAHGEPSPDLTGVPAQEA